VNINLFTLIGQMISFALFVWFTMKYVWPPLMRAMEERRKLIADGLAAGERGHHEFELSQQKATEALREAREHAADMLVEAGKRAGQILDEAKKQAKEEGERLITAMRVEAEHERNAAREQLRQAVAELAVAGAAKILEKEIDAKAHARLLDGVIKEL
jgi:F-type H+-transporting ATPase subunit b